MAEEEYLTCYNKACADKKFRLSENNPTACKFHPGVPVFHEGLKGWSCCDKRFTDFQDFLDHPGCAIGEHTNEKPAPEPREEKGEDLKPGEVLDFTEPEPVRVPIPEQQAKSSAEFVALPVNVTNSSKKALEKLKAKLETEKPNEETGEVAVVVGQACTNKGCAATYESEASNAETCIHHPGAPVFHEGMKYWSCCPKKKTHDFTEFMGLKGCTEGKHVWVKSAEQTLKEKQCRHDYVQIGDKVTVSVYAKCVDPEKATFQANDNVLSIKLVFEGFSTYEKEFHLGGQINPGESSVNLMGTKAEIILKKAAAVSWSNLESDS